MLSKITKSLPSNIFSTLFLAHIQEEDTATLKAKTAVLQQFQHELEQLDCNYENQSTFLHWASIASGFSSAIALTGMSVLNPLLALTVAVAATSSAATVIGGSFIRNRETSEQLQKLKRYTLVLSSSSSKEWATLWHIAGDKLFAESVISASKGHITYNGKLERHDGRNALAVAVDFVAERLQVTRAELLERAKSLIITTTPTALQLPVPARPQDATQDYEQNAVSIIDNLVIAADNRSLGGCVIIASPGAGKTTFLGTAWGRLKNHYGGKLQSLAVVVKKSDLPFFKRFATKALCVKDNPVYAAVEIIKFVDAGMKAGKITRLFLDDFLTMNTMLKSSLSNVFIDPVSYCVSDKRETGFVPLLSQLYATLNEAWLVGREYNLCLWVSSHSPNLDALPFCGSRDSRSVGDIIFLAKNSKREFLELSLSNAHLISNAAKRQELKSQLDKLDSGNLPIVLSNNNNWTLGIVPEFISDEYQGYKNQCLDVVDAVVEDSQSDKQLDARQQLETLFQLPSASTPSLTKVAATILEIIKSGNPPIKFDAIRKSKRWKDGSPISATVREGLDELISKELITGDNENGYCIAG
jgi:hypothetical protein